MERKTIIMAILTIVAVSVLITLWFDQPNGNFETSTVQGIITFNLKEYHSISYGYWLIVDDVISITIWTYDSDCILPDKYEYDTTKLTNGLHQFTLKIGLDTQFNNFDTKYWSYFVDNP